MANSLGVDLTNKTVRLKPETHAPDWRQPEHLLFKVTGGFGALPFTRGTALVGEYVCDGERARVDGFDVESVVDNPENKENSDAEG